MATCDFLHHGASAVSAMCVVRSLSPTFGLVSVKWSGAYYEVSRPISYLSPGKGNLQNLWIGSNWYYHVLLCVCCTFLLIVSSLLKPILIESSFNDTMCTYLSHFKAHTSEFGLFKQNCIFCCNFYLLGSIIPNVNACLPDLYASRFCVFKNDVLVTENMCLILSTHCLSTFVLQIYNVCCEGRLTTYCK